MSERLEALQTAKTEPEVLAALAWVQERRPGKPSIPAPADLATWWTEATPGELQEPAREAGERLAALVWPAEWGELDGINLALWPPGPANPGEGPPPPRLAAYLAHSAAPAPGAIRREPGGATRAVKDRRSAWRVVDLEDVHRCWVETPEDRRPRHPWAPLVRAWWDRGRPLPERRLIVTEEPAARVKAGQAPLTLARTPGLLHLATLAAVEVDGEPFVTREIGAQKVRMARRRVVEPVQGELFPGPRTLAGEATAGALVEAVADLVLDGDERSPIRADVLRLGKLAFALTGAARLTTEEGARLVGGTDTEANRERFNRGVVALRYLHVGVVDEIGARLWCSLADAEAGIKVSRIGPARWILDRLHGDTEGKGPVAFRLTGGLFRPVLFPGEQPLQSGPGSGYWGGLSRTLAGLEAALCWGPSPGKGKRGRLPDSLRPAHKGGPGPEVFVPWWQVLRLAGESVTRPARTTARRLAATAAAWRPWRPPATSRRREGPLRPAIPWRSFDETRAAGPARVAW